MEWRRTIALVAFCLSLLFAGFVAGSPNPDANCENTQTSNQSRVGLTTQPPNHSPNRAQEADCDSPHWYAAIKRPDGWLVVVGLITCIVIGWQSWETKRAAEAAANSVDAINRQADIMERQTAAIEKQADFMVAQSRAWLVVTMEGEPGNRQKAEGNWVAVGYCFHWKIKNWGNSPAFIVRMGARWHPINDLGELPPDPDIESIELIQRTAHYPFGLSVGPGESIDRYTLAEYPQMGEIVAGRIIQLAYGVVEYKTAYEPTKTLETRFCYRLNVGNRGERETLIPSEVPATYNRAT